MSGAIALYKAEPEMPKESCPLDWWKVRGGAHPLLANLAMLAIQPTHDVSDHDLVTWLFSVKRRPPRQSITYHFCSLKRLDVLQFSNDVMQSELFLKPATTTDGFADQLDTVITDILNQHCPLQTRRKIASSPQVNQWLSDRAVRLSRSVGV